jgi:aminopeptidase N
MRVASPLSPALRALTTALLLALGGGCLFGDDPSRTPTPAPTPGPSASLAPPPLPSGRLPDTARPLGYDVSLVVDPAKDRFTGDVTIHLDVPAPTQAIVLHGRDLTIWRAEVAVGGRRVAAEASFRAAAGSHDAPDELVMALAERIPAGPADLRVSWSAPISDRLTGLFRVRDGGDSYAYTMFEPTDARRVLPCFDEPGYKTPFELEVTTPKGNLVVANAPEIDRIDVEDGRSTLFRFAPTAPLPTYLVAFAVGPLEIREGPRSPVPLRLVAPRGKGALADLSLETAAAELRLLAEYFDRPYPYGKLDLVAVPELGFGAMENAGLASFREELVLLDPKAPSVEARRAMATALAHELAHQWVGNLVTFRWWDDLWLAEGFATWMAARTVDAWRPALGARLEALRAKTVVMEQDALDSARAVRREALGAADVEEAFDGMTYDKGAAVLGMLEAWLGPAAFRDGVRAFVKGHEGGGAVAADLFDALGKASGKDVWAVASPLVDQPGVPLLRAELHCAAGEPPRVALAAERHRARAGDRALPATAWRIPLCVAHEGDRGTPACGLLEGPKVEIPLRGGPSMGLRPAEPGSAPSPAPCPRWIYPNADEAGYFRFALPPENLRALARAHRDLPVAERAGLVADAWALVESGDLGADALLDLLEGMRDERNRLVIEEVILALSNVGRVLVDDDARPRFRAFVTRLLQPVARELGWDAKKGEPDDRRLLRASVLSALSDLADDPWVAAEAEKRAAAWLAGPGGAGDDRRPGAVPGPDVAAIALRAASRRAGEKRWSELVATLRAARSPEDRVAAASALGGFGDPALLRRALDLVLTDEPSAGEGPVKLTDAFNIEGAALARPEAWPVVRAWVKDRFGELRGRMPDFALGRLAGVVETLCDARALEDAATFFGAALHGTEGGERALVLALEKAELCIDLRARETARARRRLGVGR